MLRETHVWSHLSCPASYSAGLDRADDKVSVLLTRDEREQIRVDLLFVRRAHAVRQARINFQRRILDQLGRLQGRGADRYDLVIVAMQDQGRDVELLQI